jgi:uncharacterized protein
MINKNIKRYILFIGITFFASMAYFWHNKNGQNFFLRNFTKNKIHNSQEIKTLYGSFQIKEPIILDLIESPVMQRIKRVHQYGISFFIKENQNEKKLYTRYDHCLGVWALLKRFGTPLNEQIAGLLHDTSHTVFSHTGDYVFKKPTSKDAYQDDIHEWFLKEVAIDKILKKHKISLDQVLHKSGNHKALEQELPNLCADRLEYNLAGGLIEGFIDKKDIEIILNDICFENDMWFFNTIAIAKKFCDIPLRLMIKEWGGPETFLINTWSAAALKRAMEINLISYREMHFSTDDVIWNRIFSTNDEKIQKLIKKAQNCRKMFSIVNLSKKDTCDHIVQTKFRGINPWIKRGKIFKRLTDVDDDFSKKYFQLKKQVKNGWPINLIGEAKEDKNKIKNLIA